MAITEVMIGLIGLHVMRDIPGCTPDIALMATRTAFRNHLNDEPTALSVMAITAESLSYAEAILTNSLAGTPSVIEVTTSDQDHPDERTPS